MIQNHRQQDCRPLSTIERIKAHLAFLKLSTIHKILDDELTKSAGNKTPPTETILLLLDAEVQAQKERKIERRIKESKLPERKTLAQFDFTFQPGLDKTLVMELATMGFVHRRQGVILAGNSGTGKSHIAKALALEGCRQLFWVRYTTAAAMLADLYASLADSSLDRKLKRYIHPELLVIDEVGFDRLEQEDARNAALFFKVVEGRYAKSSTVISTNIDFEQLGHYLGDPIVTTSIVDRLVHHSTVISIEGPSWRHKESKELNKAIRAQYMSKAPIPQNKPSKVKTNKH